MGYSIKESEELTSKMSAKTIIAEEYTSGDVLILRDMLVWMTGHASQQQGKVENLDRDLKTINTLSYRAR